MDKRNIRETILNSMEILAERKGLTGTTTDELAAEAGISKRTLYRYFISKEKVIEAMFLRLTERIEKLIREVIKSDQTPPEKLRQIALLVYENIRFMDSLAFGELQKHYPDIWSYIDDFRTARIGQLESILTEGVDLGYFRNVDSHITITAILAAVRAVINPSFICDHSISLDEAFRKVFDLFLFGINTENKK
ncbi:MAG: TetR/AcrR family transcriptional regulator [Firmicutes bacterium]|nr:TetR/AcrR family transcriptional regulator [Bacillota bacterium]